MFSKDCRTGISDHFGGQRCDLLIALHARRSAVNIAELSNLHRSRPLIDVLTGTDPYRDIDHDPQAQQSLRLATHLGALQDQGPLALHASLRHKCSKIHRLAPPPTPLPPVPRVLCVVLVVHLRDEINPLTFMRAAVWLRDRSDIHWQQIDEAIDPTLADAAQRSAARCSQYR